jgi:hypothetical protein
VNIGALEGLAVPPREWNITFTTQKLNKQANKNKLMKKINKK